MSDMEFDLLEGQTDIYGNVAEATVVAGCAGNEESGSELFEGDTGTLPVEARLALCALIKDSYISKENRRLWQALEMYQAEISSRLADMFLALDIRPRAGVAAARQAECPNQPVRHKIKAAASLKDIDAVLLGVIAEEYFTQKANGKTNAYVSVETLEHTIETVYADVPDKVTLKKKTSKSIERFVKDRGFLHPSSEDFYRISEAVEFFDYEAVKAALETYRVADSEPDVEAGAGFEEPEETPSASDTPSLF